MSGLVVVAIFLGGFPTGHFPAPCFGWRLVQFLPAQAWQGLQETKRRRRAVQEELEQKERAGARTNGECGYLIPTFFQSVFWVWVPV